MRPHWCLNMIHNKFTNPIEIVLIGNSPEEKLSGGARINTWISIFKINRIKINLLAYYAYSDKLKIEYKNIDELLGTTTIYFPARWPRFLKAFLLILFNFFYAWKSSKTSDLMLYVGGTALLLLPMIVVSKLRNKPILFDYLDIEVEKVHKVVYTFLMRNTTCIFAISHYLVDKANSYGCKTIAYVPAFVDTNLFQLDTSAREKMRNGWGVNNGDVIIGYAGALAYKAGIPILLRSFKNLSKKHPQISLFILGTKQVPGEGDGIPELIKELDLEGKVTLIPPVTHEEVPRFLSACDILCSPQIDCEVNRAANPIKVIEYLSMGIPTISSSIGEVPRIIQDGINGFLTKPGDVNDLEKKLEKVILNPDCSKKIGDNGRNIAIEKYSYDAIADTIMRVLIRIVNTKK